MSFASMIRVQVFVVVLMCYLYHSALWSEERIPQIHEHCGNELLPVLLTVMRI